MALVEQRASCIEAIDPTPMPVLETPMIAVHDRGLKIKPRPTHPSCEACCAVRLCHWCVRPSPSVYGQDGYLQLQWHDGYWYGACPDHHKYLRASILGDIAPNVVMAGSV